MTRLAIIVLSLMCAAGSAAVHAETLRWVCEYKAVASPKGLASEAFKLEFALDTISKKSVLIGNAGVSRGDWMTTPDGFQLLSSYRRLGEAEMQARAIFESALNVRASGIAVLMIRAQWSRLEWRWECAGSRSSTLPAGINRCQARMGRSR